MARELKLTDKLFIGMMLWRVQFDNRKLIDHNVLSTIPHFPLRLVKKEGSR